MATFSSRGAPNLRVHNTLDIAVEVTPYDMGGAISFESKDVAGAVPVGFPFSEEPSETQLTTTFLTSYGFDPSNTNSFGIIATVSVVQNAGIFGPVPNSVTPVVTFPIGEPTTTTDDLGSVSIVTPTSVVTCTEFNDGLLPNQGAGAATDQLTCQIPNTAIAPGIVTVGFLGPSVFGGPGYFDPQYAFSVDSKTTTTSTETTTSTSFVDALIVGSATVTAMSYLVTVSETPTTTLTGISTSYVSCLSSTSSTTTGTGTASTSEGTTSTSTGTTSTSTGTISTTGGTAFTTSGTVSSTFTDTAFTTIGAASTTTSTASTNTNTSTTTSTASTSTGTASTNTGTASTSTEAASATTTGVFSEATQSVFILEAYGVPRILDGSDGAVQSDDTFQFAASNTGTLLSLLTNGQVVDSGSRAASVPISRSLRKRQESTDGSRIFFAAADDDSFEACDCAISSNNKLSCTCDSLTGLIIGTSGDLLGVLAIGEIDGFQECAPVAVVDPQSLTSISLPTYPTGDSTPEHQTGGPIPEYPAGDSATGGSNPAYAADGSMPTYAADGPVPAHATDESNPMYAADAAGNFTSAPTTLVTKVIKTVTAMDCDSESAPTPALHRRQTTSLASGFSGPDFTFSEGNNVATVTSTETSVTVVSTLIVGGTVSTVTEVMTSGMETTTVTSAETTTTLSTTATQDDRMVSTVTGCAPTGTVR